MNSIMNMNLISKGDAIVVAVSGGIDSMVLLDALCAVKNEMMLSLSVAHVNHRVRKESEEEYEFVQKKCMAYGIPFEGMILEHQDDDNFHNYARTKRYAFFQEVAQKHEATKIALAHHADDQAETILMRLVRGSGFIGYAGIQETIPYKNLTLIRPLLHSTKAAIREYQEAHAIEYRNDASNGEDKYTRNRYRHHLLPFIEKEDPKFHEKFQQFSTYVLEAYRLISRMADDFLASSVTMEPHEASFRVQSFLGLDRAIARDVLKKIIDRLLDDSLEISFSHLNDILRLAESPKPNARIAIDKRLKVARRYEFLTFQTNDRPKIAFSQQITGVGTHSLETGDTVIIGEKGSNMDGISIELWYNNLDFVFPITVRTRERGDRIRLSGGTKKLSDLLIDLKIPKDERDRLLVLANPGGEIFWIPGIKIGSLAREGEQSIDITFVRGN